MSRAGRVVMGTLQGSVLAALGSASLELPALHMPAEVASEAKPPVPCRPWMVMRECWICSCA